MLIDPHWIVLLVCCTIVLSVIMAMIFLTRFRNDLKAQSGEASLFGMNIKGALIGVIVIVAYCANIRAIRFRFPPRAFQPEPQPDVHATHH